MASSVTLYFWEAWGHGVMFWGHSIRSYGRLLSGEETDGADGDTVAEQNPKRRGNRCWTSLAWGEGVRRRRHLASQVF